jgi:parallel beta-helix repeat protein
MAVQITTAKQLARAVQFGAALLAALIASGAVHTSEAAAASRTVLPGESVQAAVAAAAPGETVYLSGAHAENVTIGASRITLTSAPGEAASLRGRLIVWDGANDVVVSNLRLDGRNAAAAPSPTVLGDRAVFRDNDVTNANTEICFILGSLARGYAAERTIIAGNRIHNCGKLPARNGDHGIYVEYARDTLITKNEIYDNADRGIQLYPDADRTLIENNLISGNGEGIIFSGSGSLTSDDNIVRNNIIANSTIRYNVEYYYSGSARGSGNVVTENCIFGGKEGNIIGAGIAFWAYANVVAAKRYLGSSASDARLGAEALCGRDTVLAFRR